MWSVATFVYGLAFGSFLNVCIYRLPLGRSIVRPRSACPNCNQPINFYDNIPVLSWFLLRGRCRNCSQRISPRYWIVELVVASLFLASYWQFGPALATIKACAFCFLIVGLICTDADHKLLPDELTYSGVVLGLGFSPLVTVPGATRLILIVMQPRFHRLLPHFRLISFSDALIAALFGGLFIFAVGEFYFRVRGIEGMGFGDVKLMAMIGAFLGLKLTLFTILTASFTGMLYGLALVLTVWMKRWRRLRQRRRQTKALRRAWNSAQLVFRFHQIPFGVFLGAMGLVGLFFGDRLANAYLNLFH